MITTTRILREKCPNTELFLVRIHSEYRKIWTKNNCIFGHFSRSGTKRTDENRVETAKRKPNIDQNQLRINQKSESSRKIEKKYTEKEIRTTREKQAPSKKHLPMYRKSGRNGIIRQIHTSFSMCFCYICSVAILQRFMVC